MDYPDNYEMDMLRKRDAMRQQAEEERDLMLEYAEIPKYIAALEGRMWPKERATYKSKFVDPMLSLARVETITALTDIRPTIAVKSSDNAYDSLADILGKIIVHQWRKSKFPKNLTSVVDHALLCVGYLKHGAVYHPSQLVVTTAGADNVMPINCGDELQESSAIRYTTYQSVARLVQRFGEKARGVERYAVSGHAYSDSSPYKRPPHLSEYTWQHMSPTMKRRKGVVGNQKIGPVGSAFPVVEVDEFWIDDDSVNDFADNVLVKNPQLGPDEHNYWYWVGRGERLWPRKRLQVWVGDICLYDGPSPYWHGLFPFSRLILNPFVWGSGSLSKYRNLLPLSQSINSTVAGIEDSIKKVLNRTLISKRGAVADADWKRFYPDIPGQKLRLTPTANPSTDIQWSPSPDIPQSVFQALISYLLPQFRTHAGMMDIQGIAKKKQLPGGEAIEQMTDAMPSPHRMESAAIEELLLDSAPQAISNIIQHFTRSERMHILGKDGMTWEDFTWKPDEMIPSGEIKSAFWRQFSLEFERGSLHGGSKDREKQVAISMAAKKLTSIRDMLRRLGYSNPDKILQEIKEEAEMGFGGGAGRAPRTTRGQRNGQVA